MTVWTKLDIVNLAFNKLNKNSVNDLSNSGEFADSASRMFDILLPSELSTYSWRFATRQVTLSKTVVEPVSDLYANQFQLPADYLAAVRTEPLVDYQIFEDKIWTNAQALDLEYRFEVDPSKLPAYFVHYFFIKLASLYADSVSNDPRLAQKLEQEALLEKEKALFTDSQSHPTVNLVNNPVINARFSSSSAKTSSIVEET